MFARLQDAFLMFEKACISVQSIRSPLRSSEVQLCVQTDAGLFTKTVSSSFHLKWKDFLRIQYIFTLCVLQGNRKFMTDLHWWQKICTRSQWWGFLNNKEKDNNRERRRKLHTQVIAWFFRKSPFGSILFVFFYMVYATDVITCHFVSSVLAAILLSESNVFCFLVAICTHGTVKCFVILNIKHNNNKNIKIVKFSRIQ